ncbi:MAG: histidine phosphatase family protein [Pseudomonadota bacterium]
MSEAPEPTQAEHVILLRHAQVDTAFKGDERDRPLSTAGKAAARKAARDIFGEGHHPGPLLVSTALAARQTAEIMVAELHIDIDVVYSDQLYGAPPELLEAQLRVQAVAYTLVTLIAHNPGLTDLARFLASNGQAPVMRPAEWRYLPWPPTR